MSAKVSIFKTSADGEQVNCEIDLTKEHFDLLKARKEGDKIIPGVSLREQLNYMFRLVDERLFEMNQRIMASNVLVKGLSPEGQYAIHNVMEVLHGRSSGPAPAEILEEARREREATARNLEAAQKLANQDVPE